MKKCGEVPESVAEDFGTSFIFHSFAVIKANDMERKIVCCGGLASGSLVKTVLSAFLIVSCVDPVCLGTMYEPFEKKGQQGPGDTGNDEVDPGETVLPEKKKTLYVTGVEYPEGYDWLPEMGGGGGGAVLFLMKDGERIVEVDVGAEYLVSADADMHRNIGDHIYTDFSTDDHTVIKMDGAELFRFGGREMVLSMAVSGDDVYTLGAPRSGTGFTYRRNGELLLRKADPVFVSGLYTDGGDVVFSYGEKVPDSREHRYYYMKNMVSHVLHVGKDVVVDDIMIVDGIARYIACFPDKSYRVISSDGESAVLEADGGTPLSGLSFVQGGGGIFVKGNTGSGTVFWRGEEVVAEVTGEGALSWSADMEKLYVLVGNDGPSGALTLMCGSSSSALPSRYGLIYTGCMDADSGRCCVAVSDTRDGNAPALWEDGTITSYPFNGFFTSVSFQMSP